MKTLKQKREEATKAIAKKHKTTASKIHVCMADDMHPYNCDGMFGGSCIHCEMRIERGHDPKTCALCNWDKNL
jgi:hypothetical protein